MERSSRTPPARLEDPRSGEFLAIEAVAIHAAIDGPFARTTLQLTFRNQLGRALEADLVFPLPPSAALGELSIRLQGRQIEGKIRPRARAQAEYRRAVEAGQSAALGESEGEDLARVRVAPVEAGERVEVRLVLDHLLDPIDDGHRLLLPLTYMPRFVEDPAAVTAVERAAEERPRPGALAARATALVRVLRREGRSARVRCASHTAQVEVSDDTLLVSVGPTPLDRDLHLDVLDRPSGDEPVLWFSHDARPREDGLGGATAAAILPPLYPGDAPAIPRTVTFLVDRSGSMAGPPMESALRAVRESLRSLAAADRFNILAFDDRIEALADGPFPPTPEALAAAERFLASITARGGTHASAALAAALDEGAAARFSPALVGAPRPAPGHRLRLVVFMTDGDVAGAAAVLAAGREKLVDTRVHVLGIGPAVHHGMLGEIARVGGGTYEPVASSADLEGSLRSLSRSIQGPVWTGIEATLRGPDGSRSAPPALEPAGSVDLFVGRPLLLAWRGPIAEGTRLVLSGQRLGGDARVEIPLTGPGPADAPPAAALWALLRNRRLTYRFDPADDPALEDLGVQFGLVNRAVALVGIDPAARDVVARGSVPVSLPLPTAAPAPAAPSSSSGMARGKMISLGVPAVVPQGRSFINFMIREIHCRIVLHGPAGAGKATCLRWLRARFPDADLHQIDESGGAVLFFEAPLPPAVQIRGFRLRVRVCTVTGKVFDGTSRKLLLKGASGVLFVADSDPAREEANIESLDGLEASLLDVGESPEKMPLVRLYNKRDLPDALALGAMNDLLNPRGLPVFEAQAARGVGVLEAFKALVKQIIDSMKDTGSLR